MFIILAYIKKGTLAWKGYEQIAYFKFGLVYLFRVLEIWHNGFIVFSRAEFGVAAQGLDVLLQSPEKIKEFCHNCKEHDQEGSILRY